MNKENLPPIISGGLYQKGKYGLLIFENQIKSNRLSDMWAHLYYQALTDNALQKVLFSPNLENVAV